MRARSTLSCALALVPLVILVGCPGGDVGEGGDGGGDAGGEANGDDAAGGDGDRATIASALEEGEDDGPPFVLGEAEAPADDDWTTPAAPAEGEALDEAATAALLGRLPALPEADVEAFARREGPPPPERAGETVEEPFPPPPAEAPDVDVAAGPLEVLRHQPVGDVALAPHLSLTFSQPMVPVGSVAEVAAGDVPVRLEPEPAGRWRWVGTRTLLFEPEGERFPMATEYAVEVPAGTTSATGGELAEGTSFAFRTPPPRIVARGPTGGPTEREPVCWVTFDQRVEPEAVLGALDVTAAGEPVAVRLATEAEAEAVRTTPGRSVVLRPAEPLPAGTSVEVRVGPGTPSAEGPRTATEAEAFSFRTYGPLTVTGHQAGWGERCPPGAPFRITFSNPLDPELAAAARFEVEPAIEGLRVHAWGRTAQLQGATRANTTYTVTLSPKIADVFGQTLGKTEPLTFRTTDPTPGLQGAGENVVILDPAGEPRFTVRSIAVEELRVRVYAVDPTEDWPAYAAWRGRLHRDRRPPPPGREVFADEVEVPGDGEAWVETAIDLAAALEDGLGHAVLHVAPVDWPDDRWRPQVTVWAQATRLGVDAQSDASELVAWVTELADGAPVHGAEVELLDGGARVASAATDDAGLARLGLGRRARTLVARKGDDAVLLPGSWRKSDPGVSYRWFTFDDRHLYRPQEEVHVKGWVRRYDRREGGDVEALGASRPPTGYRVVDAHGQEVAKGAVALDRLGGFDLSFSLPDTVHVGQAHVRFDGGHAHGFRIAEFRRPEFEVTVDPGSAGPHLMGEELVLTAKARYFAGGVLPAAPVAWKVEAHPATFTPPNRRGWAFGDHLPWWARGPVAPLGRGWGRGGGPQPLHTESFSAETDAAGEHHLAIRPLRASRPGPVRLAAEATVQDVNRQAWSGSAGVLVHPAEVYVGLRLARPYVPSGEDLGVEALVVDLDGEAVAGREVAVVFERIERSWTGGELKERVVEQETRAVTSAEAAVGVALEAPTGGLWRVVAAVRDAGGRRSRTVTQVWGAGGRGPATRKVEEERVTLVPDRETYGDGDEAEVLVIAPFAPAEGLMTLRRSGVVETVRFRMDEATTVLPVEIDDGLVPGATVHVALVGSAPRAGEPDRTRPAFAAGSVLLRVPPRRRALDVVLQPAAEALSPGSETAVDVRVTDHAGQPVEGAQVALAVVDEAVLSLAGHDRPDPLGVFYAPRPTGVRDARARALLRLQAPPPPEAKREAEMERAAAMDGAAPPAPAGAAFGGGRGGGGGGGQAPPPIDLRKDLRALAVFAPSVATDAQGRARVSYTLPDSLTRFRLIAVAAAGARSFGAQESTITARLPLMVRPSLPRFLNFGDRCELPVVLQNQTDAPLEVEVALRATHLAFPAGQGRRLVVPARDRLEVRFPASAEAAGRAVVQVAAAAGEQVDAQQVELPVWTPATSEAFATYGVLDGAEAALAQPVAPPADAFPQFGGLELTTSSTGLQALTDAVIYLADYPYGCAEQVSSRVLALAAVRDVLAAFEADGLPSAAALERALKGDLERLGRLQNPADGGWGFWRAGEPSWPYLTIHVTHALHLAREKGYAVDDRVLARAHGYLKQVEGRIPAWYSLESRRALIAYALSVRAKLGDPDVKRARRLVAEAGLEDLPLEAQGWIYPLLRAAGGDARADAERIRRHLANRVVETAGAAHFATSYSDGAHVLLHSNRRADGVILDALLHDPAEARGDLAPKLVQGLLAHREKGRWGNTQENAFVLLALDRYFRTAEGVTPDFVVRAWLGDAYAGGHTFAGRTTERSHVSVPMAWLQEETGAAPRLTIAKEGPGRLYYRIGLRYAPRDLDLDPLDAGFTVERRYEAIDDPADVTRDEDGTWRVRAGARVRVRVTMLAPSRRYHVALVDPLPAGFEPLDPALAATGSLPADPAEPNRGGYWWWSRTWYEHSGLRDERAEAFTSLLWAGVHTFTYSARATTPGSFVAPPAKAEEMYAPETFGRSATDRVIVE